MKKAKAIFLRKIKAKKVKGKLKFHLVVPVNKMINLKIPDN
jgi:hypothetical protein